MESTYGNRSHGGTPNYVEDLTDIFKRTFERGGNVVIPSFAVGRTQELLYIIRKIKEDNLVGRDLMYIWIVHLLLKRRTYLLRMWRVALMMRQ